MNNSFVAIALYVCLFALAVFGQNECTCKDSLFCAVRPPDCSNLAIRVACRATCGLCKRCPPPKPLCSPRGTCFDRIPLICLLSNPITQRCTIFRQFCHLSCGLCRTCRLPENKIKCTLDCEDTNPNCEHWKAGKHCLPTSKFPDVKTICPKSCGRCIQCKLPPPANASELKVSGPVPTEEVATTTRRP